jgi:hypothetical protein
LLARIAVTGAGGALIAREDIKARMIEEAALAVDRAGLP